MSNSPLLLSASLWAGLLGTGWLRDATRHNFAVLRTLTGLHRTPLLREQVKRLKLNPNAPFSPPKKEGDVVWLQER